MKAFFSAFFSSRFCFCSSVSTFSFFFLFSFDGFFIYSRKYWWQKNSFFVLRVFNLFRFFNFFLLRRDPPTDAVRLWRAFAEYGFLRRDSIFGERNGFRKCFRFDFNALLRESAIDGFVRKAFVSKYLNFDHRVRIVRICKLFQALIRFPFPLLRIGTNKLVSLFR